MYSLFSANINDDKYDPRLLNLYKSRLSCAEFERFFKISHEIRKKLFLVAHGELRTKLAALLDTHPEFVQIEYTKHGKPIVSRNAVFFSIAHSAESVFLVISKQEIGIDAEFKKIRNFDKLAKFSFQIEEANEIINEEDEEKKMQKFYECWTKKEALIKLGESKLLTNTTITNPYVFTTTSDEKFVVSVAIK